MKGTFLMVLEVSQKQSYIFNEKRLKNNILASDAIAYVTSTEFFTDEFSDLYSEEENMIYAGGGHTYLIFSNKEKADLFAGAVSRYVLKEFPGMELFIKTIPYLPADNESEDDKKAFAEKGPVARINKVSQELEFKKGLRKASFFQTTFGIENSGKRRSTNEGDGDGYMKLVSETIKTQVRNATKKAADKTKLGEETVNVEVLPDGYEKALQLEDLGGSKGKSNFIAVIHIDGNQMGNRIINLSKISYEVEDVKKKYAGSSEERLDFELWRLKNRRFSESIDYDFKKALCGVYQDIARSFEEAEGIRNVLKLKPVSESEEQVYFPLRKIIASGDDICIITEGRIGLECAVRFIHHLEKQKNFVDGKGYFACAGVAIVHQKYPFYRAYELAEELCSNAKKRMLERIKEYNSNCIKPNHKEIAIGGLSGIDWHIEYGEMKGSLDDIRDSMVTDMVKAESEQVSIVGRPYEVTDAIAIYDLKGDNGKSYDYDAFRKLTLTMQKCSIKSEVENGYSGSDSYLRLPSVKVSLIDNLEIARNKQKGMRNAIKDGKEAFQKYLKLNRISDNLTAYANSNQIFDSLEAVDLFLPLERQD